MKPSRELVGAVLIPVAALVVWHLSRANYWLDDAFITFRYAQHLAAGHGLVWNIGEEPTQGYSDFLFVALLAAGIRLGLDAPVVAHALNGLGLVLVSVSLHGLAAVTLGRPLSRILVPAAVTVMPLSFQNVTSGMETVFWTGLLFVSALLALRYEESRRPSVLAGLVATTVAAVLTRFEAMAIAPVWFLWLLARSRGRSLLPVVGAGAAVGALVGLYAVAVTSYFGDFFPNSFHLKVAGARPFAGWGYVRGFLVVHAFPMGLLLLGGGLLGRRSREVTRRLIPYGAPAVLLAVFVFVDPLMGMLHRFLYPVACLLVAAAALVLAKLLEERSWSGSAEPALPPVARAVAWTGIALLFFLEPVWFTRRQFTAPFEQKGFAADTRIGKTLARLPGVHDLVIAHASAGVIPFYSEARVLDMVGLNENRIAHESAARGEDWLVEYVLGKRPDLVSVPTEPDGGVWIGEHGVIGRCFGRLLAHPVILEEYGYVGSFDFTWNHQHYFASRGSRFLDGLRAAFRDIADFQTDEWRPGARSRPGGPSGGPGGSDGDATPPPPKAWRAVPRRAIRGAPE